MLLAGWNNTSSFHSLKATTSPTTYLLPISPEAELSTRKKEQRYFLYSILFSVSHNERINLIKNSSVFKNLLIGTNLQRPKYVEKFLGGENVPNFSRFRSLCAKDRLQTNAKFAPGLPDFS
jgi:hypothetical protein